MERERHWWRRNRPELGGGRTSRTRGRRPSLSRFLAKAALGGPYEFAPGLYWAPGSLYTRWRSVPRRPAIRMTTNRLPVVMATWRRRALADKCTDEHALLQETGGERWWLGRRWTGQRLSADAGVPPKELWRWRCRVPGRMACCGEAGSAWRGSAVRAKAGGATRRLGCAAAIRVLWARPEHAREMFDTMSRHATGHRWGWGLGDRG